MLTSKSACRLNQVLQDKILSQIIMLKMPVMKWLNALGIKNLVPQMQDQAVLSFYPSAAASKCITDR